MDVLQGSVIKSNAGHDKNCHFVVTKIDGNIVFIADGKERRLEKPKRKNMKHVSVTGETIDITDITNNKLRKLLNEFDIKVNKTAFNFQNSKS